LPKNRPVRVPAGGSLDFAAVKQGTRAWLAVGGGITVPEVMGSRSTDLIAKMGGVEGRRLVAGDVLPVGVASAWTEAMLESLGPSAKNVAWSLPPERLFEQAPNPIEEASALGPVEDAVIAGQVEGHQVR